MVNLPKIKIIFFLIILLFSSSTCQKDSFRLPYVSINLSLGINSDLGDLAAGGIKFFPKNPYGGVGGLIIYQDYDYNYFVFDAACTHDYFNDCSVKAGESFPEMVVCPCCSSSYLISSDGNVFTGPARYPLHQYYQVFVDGSVLRVIN